MNTFAVYASWCFQPELDTSRSVLYTYNFPLILWTRYGTAGLEIGLALHFMDRNVVPGSTKHVLLGKITVNKKVPSALKGKRHL